MESEPFCATAPRLYDKIFKTQYISCKATNIKTSNSCSNFWALPSHHWRDPTISNKTKNYCDTYLTVHREN